MIEIRHIDYSSINVGERFLEDDTKKVVWQDQALAFKALPYTLA